MYGGRFMKRHIALLLATLMVLSLVPFATLAQELDKKEYLVFVDMDYFSNVSTYYNYMENKDYEEAMEIANENLDYVENIFRKERKLAGIDK